MSNNKNNLVWAECLFQSELYGEAYEAQLDDAVQPAQSIFNYKDIEQMYNEIILNNEITEFQEIALQSLFVEFNNIQKQIDPHKLASFDYAINNDNELLLYRKSSIGLTNIIIHDEDCIAYSFIPYDPNSQPTLKFKENPQEACDFAFEFFSN